MLAVSPLFVEGTPPPNQTVRGYSNYGMYCSILARYLALVSHLFKVDKPPTTIINLSYLLGTYPTHPTYMLLPRAIRFPRTSARTTPSQTGTCIYLYMCLIYLYMYSYTVSPSYLPKNVSRSKQRLPQYTAQQVSARVARLNPQY